MKISKRTAVLLIILLAVIVNQITTPKVSPSPPRSYATIENIYYLDGRIKEHTLDGFILMLNHASSKDTITVYINSEGGLTGPGFKAVEAMQNSKAKKIVAVVDSAESMAGVIALECDVIKMNPGSDLMVHYGWERQWPGRIHVYKASDLDSSDNYIRGYVRLMDNFLHTQDDKFLTSYDWDTIHKGGMVYIYASEFHKRGGDHFDGRQINNPAIQRLANYS